MSKFLQKFSAVHVIALFVTVATFAGVAPAQAVDLVPTDIASCTATARSIDSFSCGSNWVIGIAPNFSCAAPTSCTSPRTIFNCQTGACQCPSGQYCAGANTCQSDSGAPTCASQNRTAACAGSGTALACGNCSSGYFDCDGGAGYDCRIGTSQSAACNAAVYLDQSTAQSGYISVTGDIRSTGAAANLQIAGMTQLGSGSLTLAASQNLLYGNINSSSASSSNLLLLQSDNLDRVRVDREGTLLISKYTPNGLSNAGSIQASNVGAPGGVSIPSLTGISGSAQRDLQNVTGTATLYGISGSSSLSNAPAATGTTYGIYGTTGGGNVGNYGVYGTASPGAFGGEIMGGKFESASYNVAPNAGTVYGIYGLGDGGTASYGVYGHGQTSTSSIPNGVAYGGRFYGQNRNASNGPVYGVYASASNTFAPTGAYALFTAGGRVAIDSNATPNIVDLASNNGDLYVEGNIENDAMAMIGSPALTLAAGQNLIYGNVDTSSQRASSLLLLQNENVDRFRVDVSGSVGIGDGTKINRLTVKSADVTNVGGTTTATNVASITGVGTRFLSTVGIGDRISVSSNPSNYVPVSAITSDTALTTIYAIGGNGSSQTINKKQAILRLDDAGGAPRVLVNDLGNVGVGTINPLEALHVSNTVDPTIRIDSAGNNAVDPHLLLGSISGVPLDIWHDASSVDSYVDWPSGGRFHMRENSVGTYTEVVTMSNVGVGIFDTVPTEALEVTGNVVVTGAIDAGGRVTTTGLNITGATTGTSIMDFQGGGANLDTWLKFRFGGSAPRQRSGVMFSRYDSSRYFMYNDGLVANGSLKIAYYNGASEDINSASTIFTLSTGGNLTITGVYSPSDRRLKENIRDFNGALSVLGKIKVHQYNLIRTGDKQTGFIAQELYDVWPEVVGVGGADVDKDAWSVNYAQMAPLIVKGVQEQQAEIDSLRSKIDLLESELKAIKVELGK